MTPEAVRGFTPDRLRLIREARKMTQTDLAEAVGISSSSVSQYEAGNVNPSPDTLSRLCEALGVGSEFLTSGEPPLLAEGSPHFRKQSELTRRSQRMVHAWGVLTIELIERLEDFVAIPEWTPASYAEDLEEGMRLDRVADQVRRDLGLGFGPISNVVWLLEGIGAVCLEVPADVPEVDKLDAFSTWSQKLARPVIFLGNGKESATRRRFDGAHELGHLLFHRESKPGDREIEAQANHFAAAFLLPEEPFAAECPRQLKWPALLELKKRWKVSLAAMVRRAYDLGIYSEATYRRGFSQLNRRGWRKDEPVEPEMERPSLIRDAFSKVRETKGEPSSWMGTPLSDLSELSQRHLLSWASAA